MENDIKEIDPSHARAGQDFNAAAVAFELSKTENLKKSEKRAWVVTIIFGLIAALAMAGFFAAILFRVEAEPVVIEVDKNTGITSIHRSLIDTADRYGDVVNQHYLTEYIQSREGYDWYTISTSFTRVKLSSSSAVFSEYSTQVYDDNAPLAVLKNNHRIIAEVTSMSYVGETVQIRFTTQKVASDGYDKNTTRIVPWIASVTFVYDSSLSMTAQERALNPLGLQITSYRVDAEVIK